MSFTLSSIDLKVLRHIYFNGVGTSEHKIAKTLRLASSTVNYSIRKMERNNIIQGYRYRLDFQKIGLKGRAWVALDLAEGGRDIMDITKELLQYPQVRAAALVTGQYDLILKLHDKDIVSLNNFIPKLEETLKDTLTSTLVLYPTKVYKQHNLIVHESGDTVKLSAVDLKIISAIKLNPELGVGALSSKFNLHRNTVSKHMGRLWNRGVIVKKSPLLNPEYYNAVGIGLKLISFMHVKKGKKDELAKELCKCEEVHNLISTPMTYDLAASIRTKDVPSFYDFYKKLYTSEKLKNLIIGSNTAIVLKSAFHSGSGYFNKLMESGIFSDSFP